VGAGSAGLGAGVVGRSRRGGSRLSHGATTSSDKTRLWNISNPRTPQHLADLGRAIAAAFSPDSSILATASDDGTTRLWDIDPDRLTRRACAQSGPLTATEWHRYLPDVRYVDPCP